MSTLKHLDINGITYDIGEAPRVYYGTCDTASSIAAKTVTCSEYTLITPCLIGIYFTTANTSATLTLNINSTGAKAVYKGGSALDALDGTYNTLKWSAYTILYFLYDGTYYRYISSIAADSVVLPEGAGCWYGTSTTTASTAAKTSAITNFSLKKGAIVSVTFSTANTYTSGAISLNINSTGAKTIYKNNATTSSSNTLLWEANTTLTFVYSGNYWYYLCQSRAVDKDYVDSKNYTQYNTTSLTRPSISLNSNGRIEVTDSSITGTQTDMADNTLQTQIGTLSNLTTTNKNNLVSAINELNLSSSTTISPNTNSLSYTVRGNSIYKYGHLCQLFYYIMADASVILQNVSSENVIGVIPEGYRPIDNVYINVISVPDYISQRTGNWQLTTPARPWANLNANGNLKFCLDGIGVLENSYPVDVNSNPMCWLFSATYITK